MSDELKPCPFCGATPNTWDRGPTIGLYVKCPQHLCAGSTYYPAFRWNRRVESSEMRAIKRALNRIRMLELDKRINYFDSGKIIREELAKEGIQP